MALARSQFLSIRDFAKKKKKKSFICAWFDSMLRYVFVIKFIVQIFFLYMLSVSILHIGQRWILSVVLHNIFCIALVSLFIEWKKKKKPFHELSYTTSPWIKFWKKRQELLDRQAKRTISVIPHKGKQTNKQKKGERKK